MARTRHSTRSLWTDQVPPVFAEPLGGDATTDVCVVGGGIAGLTTAYLLSRTRRVVLLERDAVGAGETGRTTAHLASALDYRYRELEGMFGEEGARLARESHATAIDCIGRYAEQEGFDCGYRRLDGFLFPAAGEKPEELDRELEAARRAGFAEARLESRVPLPGGETGPCLVFPGQGQLHPMAYLRGLAEAFRRNGGRLHCGTHVTEVETGSTVRVRTARGSSVSAADVVMATNTPVNDRVTMHTKQAPYRTYAIAGRVPRGHVPPGLYWDTADPYHYVRLADLSDREEMLVVGGEDHKTGQADDGLERWLRLEDWARARVPALGKIEYRWSGQVLEPQDGLGFIGRNPGDEHVFIATGHSGNGMTYGTIAGMLISSLVIEGSHPWEKLYEPSRKKLKAGLEFARENLNVAAQYAEWLKGGEVDSEEDVAAGEGALVRRGASKVAVYRDEKGVLHERSAVCPHLQCIVRWNPAEGTWDCPCHGSRFEATGRMLNGPSNQDLNPAPRREPGA